MSLFSAVIGRQCGVLSERPSKECNKAVAFSVATGLDLILCLFPGGETLCTITLERKRERERIPQMNRSNRTLVIKGNKSSVDRRTIVSRMIKALQFAV